MLGGENGVSPGPDLLLRPNVAAMTLGHPFFTVDVPFSCLFLYRRAGIQIPSSAPSIPSFSDLGRAEAVLGIKQSGIPIRKIAAQIGFSESLLRHLLKALRAPACDQVLAREGKISTNQLVRCAKAVLQPTKHYQTLIIDRNRETREAADLIGD